MSRTNFQPSRIFRLGSLLPVLLVWALECIALCDCRAADAWAPPPPAQDDFDWIQLKSGEWIKGEIIGLQDNTVGFDSVELKELTLDLEDIHVIRSGRPMSVMFDDRKVFDGVLKVDQNTVVVSQFEGTSATVNYSRDRLQAIAPAGNRERDHWTGKFSLGINATSGNTRSSSATASADLRRITPKTRGRLSYSGNFGKLEGVENVNNHRADVTFDVLVTKQLFVRPVQLSFYRDVFQNLSYRASVGVSAGYYFFNTPKLRWQVTGGPAFQVTEFISVAQGDESRTQSPTAVFSSNFEKDLTSRTKIELAYELTFTNESGGRQLHHSTSTFEVDLTKTLDLDLVFTWDRVSRPQVDIGSVVPNKDDFRLSMMLGYDF